MISHEIVPLFLFFLICTYNGFCNKSEALVKFGPLRNLAQCKLILLRKHRWKSKEVIFLRDLLN